MTQVWLLLGSNLGDREANLEQAMGLLAQLGHDAVASSLYETEPWGEGDQPKFLNQAVGLITDFTPPGLLVSLQEIEAEFGSPKATRWGPRHMDIDILLFGKLVVNHPELQIPHPHLQRRRFALQPLAEIAGSVVHPIKGQTVQQLLDACTDTLEVKRFD